MQNDGGSVTGWMRDKELSRLELDLMATAMAMGERYLLRVFRKISNFTMEYIITNKKITILTTTHIIEVKKYYSMIM